MTSTYWRFRLTLCDHPGGLADVTRAVAGLGVDVLDLDVHRLDPHHQESSCAGDPDDRIGLVADDLVVELPFWVEPTMVERALLEAGARSVRAQQIGPHDLVDADARTLALATALVRRDADAASIRAGLRSLLACEHVWLAPEPALAPLDVVDEARRSGTVAVGRERMLRLGPSAEPAWLVALPWGPSQRLVAVAAQAGGPFTATQIARARALLELAHAVRRSVASPTS